MSRTAFDEASAFFDLFVRSDWASCHVRGAGIELFVARVPGHANPLLGAIDGDDEDAADETLLVAPHLGTLAELAAIGTRIATGDAYGAIELLGERRDLVAAQDGTVRRHLGRAGDLVEYDQPLAAIG